MQAFYKHRYRTVYHGILELDVQFYFSFGTFGFWSAYLKPKLGEVVISNSYFGLANILPEWKIISDPCFSKQSLNSSSSAVPEKLHSVLELTPECLGKEIEYGI